MILILRPVVILFYTTVTSLLNLHKSRFLINRIEQIKIREELELKNLEARQTSERPQKQDPDMSDEQNEEFEGLPEKNGIKSSIV